MTQTYIIYWTPLLAIIHWSIKFHQIQPELIIPNSLFPSFDNNKHPGTWGTTPRPCLSFSPSLVDHSLTCPPIQHLKNHLWSHFSSFPLKPGVTLININRLSYWSSFLFGSSTTTLLGISFLNTNMIIVLPCGKTCSSRFLNLHFCPFICPCTRLPYPQFTLESWWSPHFCFLHKPLNHGSKHPLTSMHPLPSAGR